MQATDGARAPQGMNGVRGGKLVSRELLVGRDGTPNNYSFQIGTSESAYAVPRHRHNFDQVRYNLRGQIKYGDIVFPTGWVVYFPEGAYYGPQVREVGSLTLTGQFGGSNGVGYLSKVQQKQAHGDLKRRGTFTEKGAFEWFDDAGKRHLQDSFEAVFEQVTGTPVRYPEPRYKDIVLMNPERYAWNPTGQQGVRERHLGTFTERETRIAMLGLEKGATFEFRAGAAPEILFVAKGGVRHDGHDYGVESAFALEPGEGPERLTATADSELLSVRMPRF